MERGLLLASCSVGLWACRRALACLVWALVAHPCAAFGGGARVSYHFEVASGGQFILRHHGEGQHRRARTWAAEHPLREDEDVQTGTHLLSPYCHDTFSMRTWSDRSRSCPSACPYLAQVSDAFQPEGCWFKCVQDIECGTGVFDTNATIADPDVMHCLRCYVPGCKRCSPEHDDLCLPGNCNMGYYADADGSCRSSGDNIIQVLLIAVAAVFGLVFLWYLDLQCLRPITNPDGLAHGLDFRCRTKLHRPSGQGDEEGTWTNYPLTFNFHNTSNATVAGPGAILHFNYLLAATLWPAVVAISWFAVAQALNADVLTVGTQPDVTPAQLCASVHWGYEVQVAYKMYLVWFLLCLYIGTCLGCVLFAATQLRLYRAMEAEVTMKDFAARVEGLTKKSGRSNVEEDLKAFLEQATGERLEGVSVCWSFRDHRCEVMEVIEADMQALHAERRAVCQASPTTESADAPLAAEQQERQNCLHRGLCTVERKLLECSFGFGAEAVWAEEDTQEMLHDLRTSGYAYAVFPTQAARDAAVEKCEAEGGWQERARSGCQRVRLRRAQVEPDTVLWTGYEASEALFYAKMLRGILVIILAQVSWAVCFYMPYASYISAFSYAHGEEPTFWSGLVFSMLVVAGNWLNYWVCDLVASAIGFTCRDHREAFYTIAYTVANFLNVFVDVGITSVLSYRIMKGMGVHLEDGRRFEDLTDFLDIIVSFPMQKSLGAQLWAYNFPSTFLIPYVVEPVTLIFLPWLVMVLLVRACPMVSDRRAEIALGIMVPMDLGRYADVTVNIMLSALSFFLAGGFVFQTLVTCALVHLGIYIWDRYRVLRCVPSFYYASDFVDRFAQGMLSILCGILAVAVVFKSNCLDDDARPGLLCVAGRELWIRMGLVFTAHVALHLAVVLRLLPACIPPRPRAASKEDFGSLARRVACSWFTANPVHCLRSKHVYGHKPHCLYLLQGKEHFLSSNPDIGCYFEGSALDAASYITPRPHKSPPP